MVVNESKDKTETLIDETKQIKMEKEISLRRENNKSELKTIKTLTNGSVGPKKGKKVSNTIKSIKSNVIKHSAPETKTLTMGMKHFSNKNNNNNNFNKRFKILEKFSYKKSHNQSKNNNQKTSIFDNDTSNDLLLKKNDPNGSRTSVKDLIQQFNNNETIQKLFNDVLDGQRQQNNNRHLNEEKAEIISQQPPSNEFGTNFEKTFQLFTLLNKNKKRNTDKDNLEPETDIQHYQQPMETGSVSSAIIFIENMVRKIVIEQQQQQQQQQQQMLQTSTMSNGPGTASASNNLLLLLMMLQYQQQQLSELKLMQTLKQQQKQQEEQQLKTESNSVLIKSKEMEFNEMLLQVNLVF